MGVQGEGGEGGEGTEKAGHSKRVQPCRVLVATRGNIAKQAADEETAEQITSEDAHRETLQAGVFGQRLDAGGEAEAGHRAEAAAEEDVEPVHGR